MTNLFSAFTATVFFAGVLSFFSPCILPLIPVFLGHFAADASEQTNAFRQKLFKTLAFIGGLSTAFFLLGFGAGALGKFIKGNTFFIVCGAVIMILGLHQTGIINIGFLYKEKKLGANMNPRQGLIGAYLLGFFLSFGWTPCVGPILGSVLGFSAQNGSALKGAVLLLIYSLGLSIPFLIISLGSQFFLQKIKRIYKYFPVIKAVGGVVIVLMGLNMVFTHLPSGGQSASAEQTITSASESQDFALTDVNGKQWTRADLAEKKVYIKIWASWCPSCLAGLDNFSALSKEYADSKDTVVISIVTPGIRGEMQKADFISWAKSLELSFPILLDETGKVVGEYDVSAYPTNVFLSKDGSLFKKLIGDIAPDTARQTLSEIK